MTEEQHGRAVEALSDLLSVARAREDRLAKVSEHDPENSSPKKIGLVGCVKSKQSRPAAAADLYTSALFQGRRRWVEMSCDRWFILSAKHGLITPEQAVQPYDEALTNKNTAERRSWAAFVLEQLCDRLGDLGSHRFEIHAGMPYVDYGLRTGLVAAGASVTVPTEGLRQGEQLAFYRDQTPTRPR